MTESDFLFMLLRSELWGTPLKGGTIPTRPFQSLSGLAERQTVNGLMCSSLDSNPVKLAKYDAISVYTTLQDTAALNAKVNGQLKCLCQLLQRHHVSFVVVKGQTLARLYRHADRRIPGDIDFYCDATNFERAKAVIRQEWHVDFEADDDGSQHISFTHDDVLFEMHYSLMSFASRAHQRYFDRLISQCVIAHMPFGDVDVPVLPLRVNVLYTFLHLYHHLVELGVGLRQFCDLAMLCDRLADTGEEERQKLKADLTTLGFYRAFLAVGAVLVDKLGLSERRFPFAISGRDRAYEHFILGIVFKRGNFGAYGRKARVRSGWAYYVETAWLKCGHYLRLFPLSPRENVAALFRILPHKVKQAVRRQSAAAPSA